MKKNKIMSIGLFAILSLSLIPMLFHNSAYAQLQPVKVDSLGHNILEVHYQETTGILWALGGSRTGTTVNVLEINPVTNTLTNTYNVTTSANGGSPIDIWCGATNCFITTRTAIGTTPNAGVGAIIRIETESSTRGNVTGTYDANANDKGFGRLDGRDSTATGIGGISLYVESYDSSDNLKVINIGAVGTMAKTADLITTSTTDGTSNTFFDIQWSGVIGTTNNHLLAFDPSTLATVQIVRVWDLANSANYCNISDTISSGSGGGQLILDYNNNVTYVPVGSNGSYDSYDMSTGSCTEIADPAITSSDTGLSNALTQKNGRAIEEKSLMFFQESGSNARISTSGFNFDTESFTGENTVIEISPNNAQSAVFGRAYVGIEHNDNGAKTTNLSVVGSGDTAYNGIFIPMNSDQAILIFKFEAPTEPEEVTGINCELPANQNILICRLTETTGGNIGGLGGIIDTGLFTLFTNSGIIDGSDTDPQTNGIGYFITIAGFGVMTAMFFIATKGRLNEVPTFIWMLSAIALLGAITAIGWLDPTFLIIGIIAIVALASMQVRNTISSGLDFGRGDF